MVRPENWERADGGGSSNFGRGRRGGRGGYRGRGRNSRGEECQEDGEGNAIMDTQQRKNNNQYPVSSGMGSHVQNRQGWWSESEIDKAKDQLFNRKFQIRTSECKLPSSSDLFSCPPWDVPEMMAAKLELNSTKNKLNDNDISVWGKHTSFTNRAGDVVFNLRCTLKPEMCTIAWAKMYEALETYDLVPRNSSALGRSPNGYTSIATFHLCEAPGAFIAATNHYIRTNRPDWEWDWRATSLNPYFEGNDQGAMIDDDALIRATSTHWVFGRDSSGDIRKIPNIVALVQAAEQMAKNLGCPKVALVTADGSVDCMEDPNEQERYTAPLHYCEMVAALGMLAVGGHFFLKAFTLFEHPSLCAMYLLGALFDELHVYKPATSKPGNSETYLVAKGFRGIDDDLWSDLLDRVETGDMFKEVAMLPLSVLPQPFLDSACEAAIFFSTAQRNIIEENLSLWVLDPNQKGSGRSEIPQIRNNAIKDARRWMKGAFIEYFKIQPLLPDYFLAPKAQLSGSNNNTSNVVAKRQKATGTFDQRQEYYRQRREDLGLEARENLPERKKPQELDDGNDGADGSRPYDSMAKGANLLAKHGYTTGGLGRDGQGILEPVAANENQGRLGLGFGGGSEPEGVQNQRFEDKDKRGHGFGGQGLGAPRMPPRRAGLGSGGAGSSSAVEAVYALLPDTKLLGCDEGLYKEEVAECEMFMADIPAKLLRSKFMARDDLLRKLKAAREAVRTALPPDAIFCHHLPPCIMPPVGQHLSQSFWALRPLDRALLVTSTAAAAAADDEPLRLLDMSLGGLGGVEEVLVEVHRLKLGMTVAAKVLDSEASRVGAEELSKRDGIEEVETVRLPSWPGVLDTLYSRRAFEELLEHLADLQVHLVLGRLADEKQKSEGSNGADQVGAIEADRHHESAADEGQAMEAEDLEERRKSGEAGFSGRRDAAFSKANGHAQGTGGREDSDTDASQRIQVKPEADEEDFKPEVVRIAGAEGLPDEEGNDQGDGSYGNRKGTKRKAVDLDGDEAAIANVRVKVEKVDDIGEKISSASGQITPSVKLEEGGKEEMGANTMHVDGEELREGAPRVKQEDSEQGDKERSTMEKDPFGTKSEREGTSERSAAEEVDSQGDGREDPSSTAKVTEENGVKEEDCGHSTGDLETSDHIKQENQHYSPDTINNHATKESTDTPVCHPSPPKSWVPHPLEGQESPLGTLEGEYSIVYRMQLLWEAAVLLAVLAPGGCAVLRLRDCLTTFTASVIYVLHRSFRQVCLVRPPTSCACASERFLVCLERLPRMPAVEQLLLNVMEKSAELHAATSSGGGAARCVQQFVPPIAITNEEFVKYLGNRNQDLAVREEEVLRAVLAAREAAEWEDPDPEEAERHQAAALSTLEGRRVITKEAPKETHRQPTQWVRATEPVKDENEGHQGSHTRGFGSRDHRGEGEGAQGVQARGRQVEMHNDRNVHRDRSQAGASTSYAENNVPYYSDDPTYFERSFELVKPFVTGATDPSWHHSEHLPGPPGHHDSHQPSGAFPIPTHHEPHRVSHPHTTHAPGSQHPFSSAEGPRGPGPPWAGVLKNRHLEKGDEKVCSVSVSGWPSDVRLSEGGDLLVRTMQPPPDRLQGEMSRAQVARLRPANPEDLRFRGFAEYLAGKRPGGQQSAPKVALAPISGTGWQVVLVAVPQDPMMLHLRVVPREE